MSIAPKGADGKPDMGSALTDGDLKLVADAVLAAYDGADGVKDGHGAEPGGRIALRRGLRVADRLGLRVTDQLGLRIADRLGQHRM